ncbi:MAG: tryptophan-rich sensory protein [Alistipes sp.]|nr:tryptophan-rich sensory protein [Alistipes sp.]
MRKFLAYAIPIILSLAVGMIGSTIQTSALAEWYPTLLKSPLTPPAIVFPIAWTILYILMGVSIGILVARGDMSVVRLWLLQLLVNFLWSVGFFALRSPLAGLITILILDVLVFAYIVYTYSISKGAAWLFVPYMIWILFASYLTGYIYLNNDTNINSATAATISKQTYSMTTKTTTYTMPPLPYNSDALEPVMSKETIDYHYGKHLKGYVDNLNRLIAGTPYEGLRLEEVVKQSDGALFNNAAQVLNHTLFFDALTADSGDIPSELKSAIERDFGSLEQFKSEFTAAATSLFGSGWVWLIEDKDGKLKIISTSNADCPMRKGLNPLLVLDVWEHAYYIDYRNRRGDFVKDWWSIVDWDKVANRATKDLRDARQD